MKKLAIIAVAIIMVAGAVGTASAYTFDLGAASYIETPVDPGLAMASEIVPGLDLLTFDLAEGESETFLFAKVWTTESSIQDDDWATKSITAYIDFDNPDLIESVDGASSGWSFLGIMQGYNITWQDPVVVGFGGGGEFTVELSDISAEGFFGLPGCKKDIMATVTLNAEPVPEPASMLLFGLGLVGLASRRKK